MPQQGKITMSDIQSKINRYAKNQGNKTYCEKKKQSIETIQN